MKKFFPVMLLAVALIFISGQTNQAEANFDLNRDFNSKFVPLGYSRIYSGRVVGISTYLSLREEPSEYSREIMRIPNGAELVLRHDPRAYENGWWEVMSVSFNGQTYSGRAGGYGLGYVSTKYVRVNSY